MTSSVVGTRTRVARRRPSQLKTPFVELAQGLPHLGIPIER
ncbi:hypothetical protein I552_9109 [Mycobacterium xenopi 3993]|nr:hypothetical protein I552_9109 [Mycobacterium xenopi 3993]